MRFLKYFISLLINNQVYPTDHLLTMQERKDLTNKFLNQKGIKTLKHLPCIEDYLTARFRDQRIIASKAVIVYGLIHVAHNEWSAEQMISYLKRFNLWENISPNQRDYLEKPLRTDQENIAISWLIESLFVLLWSLGHFNKLPFPTEMCDLGTVKNFPDLGKDPQKWINDSKLRNTEEILNEADMIYRIHWAVRDSFLHGNPNPANINGDVVMERHFALNWIIMYAEDWDEVTTDT